MAAWSSRQSSSSIRTYNCVVVCRLVMCRVCAICKRRCKNNRERAQMIESPWYGDLRPVPESQPDSEDRALLIVRARHQNILKLWGLVDDTERLCAGPTFYDTPPGTFPKIWLPDGLLCVWTRLSLWNFHLWSVPQHFIPADLFQLIEVRGPRAGILCSIPTTVTHLSSEHPASTSGASLVYIPAPSPDWSGICPRTILIPFVARHQLTRQLIRSDQNLSISALASFHSSPRWLCPTVFSPFTGRIWWVLPQPQIQQPTSLRLPNSSSHSPPPVDPAPSPPTRELPLLLLGLCDNNNNCVAAQRAFCWASARPAGTGSPLSLFYHLQPIPLCLG